MFRIRARSLMLLCLLLTIASIVTIHIFTSSSNEQSDILEQPDLDYLGEEQTIDEILPRGFNWSSGQKRKYFSLEWSQANVHSSLNKPWFMRNGTIWPSSNYSEKLALWPEEVDLSERVSLNDRIINQLMYIPEGYNESQYMPIGKKPLKKILLAYGRGGWGDVSAGRRKFLQDKCPVNTCFILTNPALIDKADAVIFKDRFVWPKQGRRRWNQLWILFLLECPYHTQLFKSLESHVFNWTATYRHDSDLVAPYEKFVSYDSLYRTHMHSDLSRDLFNSRLLNHTFKKNYASGKTKAVAWFVSNCGARNKRLEYARELSKHIEVDIYGSCGTNKCPRAKSSECFKMLNKEYKFYLAFENSNCRDYITEKFYVNGLGHNQNDFNVVPIVMGAHPDDYQRASPHESYIHVDDFKSPAHLAQYLKLLDANDELYNRYFEWKATPRQGEFINTYFWCRLCALLNAPPEHQKPTPSYANFAQWWSSKNICHSGSSTWSNAT